MMRICFSIDIIHFLHESCYVIVTYISQNNVSDVAGKFEISFLYVKRNKQMLILRMCEEKFDFLLHP